ncbi:hypothetical protein STW0522ENT66_13750 [Enterobacter roggenkampii]|nr:hypothetical protein STW0522ENT66_13750 [Enterobacter roggenkampii]BBW22665.1 hypothetical protein STN0717ENT53_30000 [Enterobacter kobei]SAF37854.1 Uncharacterised protein [Enterobacter roggenkampii]
MKYEIINNNPKNFKCKYWIDGIEYYLHSTSTERYVVINNQKYKVVNGRILPVPNGFELNLITMKLLLETTLTVAIFESIANPPQAKKPCKSRKSTKK